MSETTKTPEKKKADSTHKKSDLKKDKSNDKSKTEKTASDQSGEKGAASSENSSPVKDGKASYVRGENQKPVTQAYRNNWNKIFAKTKK